MELTAWAGAWGAFWKAQPKNLLFRKLGYNVQGWYRLPTCGTSHDAQRSLMDRRTFIQLLSAAGLASSLSPMEAELFGVTSPMPHPPYKPGRIVNEYSLFLPGEKEALAHPPSVSGIGSGTSHAEAAGEGLLVGGTSGSRRIHIGESHEGWQLVAIAEINGVHTAVFEKHVTHRGAIAYVTERGGTIALIPKQIGNLANIRPRPTNNPQGVHFERAARFVKGPDIPGDYILKSDEDPCYENVAALGPEYIGWSLVANEQAGPLRSLYLEADGKSRELPAGAQASWAPDMMGTIFDPQSFVPFYNPQSYAYEHGFSKRTLLGGYLPVADTGVWNAKYQAGYEVIMLLPPGENARPMARFRLQLMPGQEMPQTGDHKVLEDANGQRFVESYWNCGRNEFFSQLVGIWNHWHLFYQDSMPVEIPDPWLLDAARAGITLSRCSYRGLKPTYQIGEGGYTKIPERSHALFPVASYEFIWAHQVWNLTRESDPYFQFYLDNYILPDGNFLYNTQDQVEAPLNVGIFLANSARAYHYTQDVQEFDKRLPTLTRMLDYVLARYEYTKKRFPKPDRRHGLIWGSPEADLGDPNNDTPDSHPYYYQNATWTWRGLVEHARALNSVGAASSNREHITSATKYQAIAEEMRQNIQTSLAATIAAGNAAMRNAGITPFEPNDIDRLPTQLSSYENHRFMMDFFTSDWGVPAYDLGYLKHRLIAGEQICGLNTDGGVERTSNFMSHGTLAVRIRQEDYRPFLLTLYALVCYAADSGNRYAPEDAYLPGSYPGEQSRYGWSSVVNSTLQPTLGLRWLLCYEESDRDICHLQKAAPKHWFKQGETIAVRNCPTRFGALTWRTDAVSDRRWKVVLDVPGGYPADIYLHIHPSDGSALRKTSIGTLEANKVVLQRSTFANVQHLVIDIE
jgi:hypothetical protein